MMGDSRGHREGDTLVIDTTNFTDRMSIPGSGARHSEATERITRIDPD